MFFVVGTSKLHLSFLWVKCCFNFTDFAEFYFSEFDVAKLLITSGQDGGALLPSQHFFPAKKSALDSAAETVNAAARISTTIKNVCFISLFICCLFDAKLLHHEFANKLKV